MVTQELINYIEDLRRKNISIDVIKNHLQKNHWTFDDVNKAFSMINYEQVDIVTTKKLALPNLKFDLVKIAVFLLSVISLFYLYSFIILILSIRTSTAFSLTEVYSVFDYSPTLKYLPFFFSAAISFLIYLAVKTYQKAYSIPIAATISLSLLAIVTPVVSNTLSAPIVKSPGAVKGIISSFFFPDYFLLGIPVFVVTIITISLVWLAKSSFTKKLSFNLLHVIFPFIPFIVLSVISFITITQNINRLPSNDYSYSAVQKSANFHVYQADPKSVGLVYSTFYTGNNFFADKDNAIQVVYELSLQDVQKENRIKATVMKQVSVDSDFNLLTFTNTDYATKESPPQPVTLSTAKNQIGYLVTRKSNNNVLNVLTLVTPDNVLIAFTSQWLSLDELTTLANTIK